MIDSYDKLKALTAEQIELDSVEVPSNIQQLVRDNFDDWVVKWFPLLKRQKKSFYGELLGLLARAGILEVTREQLRTCVWRVKHEREAAHVLSGARVTVTALPGEVVQVQPPPHVSERAVGATSPVVVSTWVGSSPQAVAAGADDRVFGRACSVARDGSWENIADYLAGLKMEKVAGWGDWSGFDEDFWHVCLDAIDDFNIVETQKFSVDRSYQGVYKRLKNDIRKEIFDLLLKKAPAVRH